MPSTPAARGCPRRPEWPYPVPEITRAFFRSQSGQDAFLSCALFNASVGGTYLDIGCNDGISNSNTHYFAQRRSWYGRCFEADPRKFKEIQTRGLRTDGVHAAVSNRHGESAFQVVNVPDGGLSGLTETLDARARSIHAPRTLRVPTVTPLEVLTTYYNQTKTIDYVSLDVEGHELEVMRAFPLRGPWCVTAFTIENNAWCNKSHGILPQLREILGAEYEHRRSIGADEVFVRRSPCRRSRQRPAPEADRAVHCARPGAQPARSSSFPARPASASASYREQQAAQLARLRTWHLSHPASSRPPKIA